MVLLSQAAGEMIWLDQVDLFVAACWFAYVSHVHRAGQMACPGAHSWRTWRLAAGLGAWQAVS